MRSILVTGGSGFAGSHLIKYINTKYPGWSVLNFDRHNGIAMRDLPHGEHGTSYFYVRGDLRNRQQAWDHTILVDVIINCAWSDAGSVPMNSNEYIETTLMGLNNLMQSGKVRGISRFVQLSTADVYGQKASGSFKEESRLVPPDLRSGIRACADVLFESFTRQWDMPSLLVRHTELYGSNMSRHELLPRTLKALTSGKVLPEQLDPARARDWLHVEDLCSAVDAILHKGDIKKAYNVGSGEVISDIDLVGKLSEATGDGRSLSAGSRSGKISGSFVNTDRVAKLGWEPTHSFDDSLPGLTAEYGGKKVARTPATDSEGRT